MDVDLFMRDAEVAHRDHRHAGERLVDLEQIDIVDAPARLFERLATGIDRRGGEACGRVRVRRVRHDPRDGLEAQSVGDTLPGQHQGRRTVGDRRGIGGGDRAVLGERGFQARNLRGIALERLLVLVDRLGALAPGNLDRNDLAVEAARALRLLCAGQRGDGVIVLVLAGELIFARRFLGKAAHRTARLIRILQAVEEHVVHHPVMADPRAAAMLGQQIRRVGHALHAARDEKIDRARGERFGAHDRRLHAAAAHLVDRGRLDRLWQACLERHLARGGLAKAGGQHAAHIDALDRIARDPSPRSTAP